MRSIFLKDTPINYDIVKKIIDNSGLANVGKATIREIRRLIDDIEEETAKKFIRMEMGVPGLKASKIGIKAEAKALENGCAESYPNIDGVPELKSEISRFIKNFVNVDIPEKYCIPTVGSINGNYASFLVSSRIHKGKDTVLFIDPGFPVHKQLVKMLGLNQESFDVYNYRGDKLHDKLESFLKSGKISSIIYSNPNNPTWLCFNEKELKIIGELATKYDTVVIEDLAYFAMDFRKDLSTPGVAPFQVSVANYTDNFILLISSSKAFSYAGQRVGIMAISEKLYNSNHEDLLKYYSSTNFGHCITLGTLYATTAGVTHSAQYGLAAILRAVNNKELNFVEISREYGQKAKIMKKLFLENGFKLVYDKDEDEPIGDGFYFTVSYDGFSGDELLGELLYYGISAISLSTTGSEKVEGIRACVSLVPREDFPLLEERLISFKENH
jgi:aspartate/methionine/tyrosine aminotransferase